MIPPENIRKPLVFWCFQGVSNEISGMKWVNRFPYKTAMSEANVEKNRMVSAKWTCHKERSFASNCFVFFEDFAAVWDPLVKSCFDVPTSQMSIFLSTGVLFDCAFLLWVSLISLKYLWKKIYELNSFWSELMMIHSHKYRINTNYKKLPVAE